MYEDAAKWISTKNGLVENHAEGAYNNVMYGTMMSDCFKYSVHDKSVDGSFFYSISAFGSHWRARRRMLE